MRSTSLSVDLDAQGLERARPPRRLPSLRARTNGRPRRDDRLSPLGAPCSRTRRAAGRPSGLLERSHSGGGLGGSARGGRRSGHHAQARLFDHPGPQSARGGSGSVGRQPDRRGTAEGSSRHDDPSGLRRAHADGATAGQDLVLHAAYGRGGRELRVPARAPSGRHELSHLSPGRAAYRVGLSARRHDVPDLFQRARSA